MSQRSNLYEKYKKSDIFNLSSTTKNSEAPKIIRSRNVESSALNNPDDNFHSIDPVNPRKYNIKHHQSDIFNLNKTFQSTKPKARIQKIRGAPLISTCFDSMKDNAQFTNDIKEYTSKYRAVKTEYEPDRYYHNEDATERLYNQLYNKKRNPILNSNINRSLEVNIDINTNNEINDKDLFVQRKKNMRNNFTNAFLDQRNINDKKKLEQETEQAGKNRKFYKSRGFTYKNNDNNNVSEHKYVTPDKINGNSSKINRQLQLQSNIFLTNDKNKNLNDIEQINERIKSNKEAKSNDKNIEKKINKKKSNKSRNTDQNENDKNIWGTVHSNWERSNLDWRNANCELIFGKTYQGKLPSLEEKNEEKKSDIPFQRKMDQLQDSGNKDTINESIKMKRKYNKNLYKDKFNHSNLEKIDEILDEIPENILKYDKKKKILFNSNTTGLNGETELDNNFVNYNKYHKNVLKIKEKKEPKIKIMSNEGAKNANKKKNLDKNFNNLKKHDDYNIHDFILSYDSKAKNAKNNFDKFDENEIKLLFSKKGIHAYDIQKNQFDNGKYNVIKFKVRENEGENSLKEKMKEIENDFIEKKYKICIEKDVEKEKKKYLRNVTNTPGSKVAMFIDNNNENKNIFKKKDPLQIKNNSKFTGQFNNINYNYKKNN